MRIPLYLLVVPIALATMIVSTQGQLLTAGDCSTDDEVSANERFPYEQAALRFVETILGDKPQEAYAKLSPELQGKVSEEDFVRLVDGVRANRPVTELRIEHSYRESQVTLGSGISYVACTTVAQGVISKLDGRVMIAALPISLQAHVIVEGKARNNRWSFVLWLLPNQPGWQFAGFYMLPTSVLDRSATDLWNLARKEHQEGHNLNSYLLYVSAAQLAARGPNLQLGIEPEIRKEMSALTKPAELQGSPPFEWKFASGAFRVANIGPIGVGKVFDLSIVHLVAQTSNNQELERQNRALITGFQNAYPEYTQIFDGLVVRALRPDGTGYATVEQKRGGQ